MENPIKMDDLGGPPLFLETPILDIQENWDLEVTSEGFMEKIQGGSIDLYHWIQDGVPILETWEKASSSQPLTAGFKSSTIPNAS